MVVWRQSSRSNPTLYGLHIPGGTQNEFLIPANRSEQERGYLFKKLVDIFYGVGNKVASFIVNVHFKSQCIQYFFSGLA